MLRQLPLALIIAGLPLLGGTGEIETLMAHAASPASLSAQQPARTTPAGPAGENRELLVTVGKSSVVDSPVNIQRVSVANGDLAEAMAVNPRELLINGKAPGDTSLIVWQQGGTRIFYDLKVRQSNFKIDAVQHQLAREFTDSVALSFDNDTAFLRGTVKDLVSADRAVAISATLGKVVNLLNVAVPPVEQQILLKVRFANVDRAAGVDFGVNLASLGALHTPGAVSTGQFSAPKVQSEDGKTTATIADALNVFLFRRDLNLAATIKALQSKRLLEVLAEPNVLAINGKSASFVAGGEFPFPTLQGGAGGAGAVTISFREFGVRINFLPTVTPRGTIRLQVAPEVSSLDFANGLVIQGFNIPALATRRVQTEVELESGQSFAIAGLLDNRVTEAMMKVPGLGDIPLLGKLFQSRSQNKNNSELMVLITPELVRPIPQGQPLPDIQRPKPFMEFPGDSTRTPGMERTGPVPVKPAQEIIPVEELEQIQRQGQANQGSMPQVQLVPVPVGPPSATSAPSSGGHK